MVKIKFASGSTVLIRPKTAANPGSWSGSHIQISSDSTPDFELAYLNAELSSTASAELDKICAECETTAEVFKHLSFEAGVIDADSGDEFDGESWRYCEDWMGEG